MDGMEWNGMEGREGERGEGRGRDGVEESKDESTGLGEWWGFLRRILPQAKEEGKG